MYDVFLYAGEDGEDDDIGVEHEVGVHRHIGMRFADAVVFILDVDACRSERGIVVRAESVEVLGVDFRRAVSAQQQVFEEDAHFGHHCRTVGMLCRGNLDRGYQVFFSVGAQHADGQLASCQDDRFAQVFQHEAQCRCRICHGVRAVQDDESVEIIVIVLDNLDQFCPQCRFHV